MKVGEREQTNSCQELNPGQLACAPSALDICLTCTVDAVDVEDCEGWWLSGFHSSVTEHWLHKRVVLGSIQDT